MSRRIDVDVEGRDLVEVLGEIARQTGIGLVVHGSDHGTVTARLHDVTLEEGISRLLEGHSFAVAGLRGEGPGGKVWLLSGGSGAGAAAVAVRPARNRRAAAARPEPATAAPDIEQLRDLLQQVDAGNFEEALSNITAVSGLPEEALRALREGFEQTISAGRAGPLTARPRVKTPRGKN